MVALVSTPQLPTVYFSKCGNYTYVRTYHNVWRPKKHGDGMTAVKTNIQRIGRIANNTGVGVIEFDPDFYKLHPEFKNFNVVRKVDEAKAGRFVIEITPKDPDAELRHLQTISHKSIGPYLLFAKLLHKEPLISALHAVFKGQTDKILSAAYYMVLQSDAKMSRLAQFASTNNLPCEPDELYPSALTRLFASLSEDKIQSFFQLYLNLLTKQHRLSPSRLWAIDSTSISTYAALQDAKFGKNKQDEALPQLNIMMLTDEESGRPLYYQCFNGSIPDIAQCINSFDMLLNLGAYSFVAVADRGFFSTANMKMIVDKGYHFVMCVPYDKCVQYQSYIDEALPQLATSDSYDLRCGQLVYRSPRKVKLSETKDAYVHVFLNPESAGAQINYLHRRCAEVKQLYRLKQQMTAENQAFMDKYFIRHADGSFALEDDGKTPKTNQALFNTTIKNAGIFMVISDSIKLSNQAYRAYKMRQTIEDNFATLKVRMGLKRTRVSTEDSLCGKCFIEFIALTLYSFIQAAANKAEASGKASPHHSIAGLLAELSGIEEYYFSDRHAHIVNTLSKAQRATLKYFGLKAPESHYEKTLAPANELKEAWKPHGHDLQAH